MERGKDTMPENTTSVLSTHAMQTNNYNMRTETYEGKEHIVVPMVMMVEGVHCGSHGPILHTISELGKYVGSWNGIPIPILHPKDGDTFISANSPSVLQKRRVGWVFNSSIEGKKLKAEAWLDKDKLAKISPKTLTHIQCCAPMDVSVGVYTDDDPTPGIWDGVSYTSIARNHRPDHLALLPGETGACSWEKGCGIRANAEGGDMDVLKDLESLKDTLTKNGLAIVQTNTDPELDKITANIGTMLSTFRTDTKSYHLIGVYKDHFIFEVSTPSIKADAPITYEHYKHAYTSGVDGKIDLVGEPEEVNIVVNYALKGGNDTMIRKNEEPIVNVKKESNCPDKVELLINSKHSPFEATDKEWLNTLEVEQVDKLLTPITALETNTVKAEEENVENKMEPVVHVTQEDMMKTFQEKIKTPEDFLNILPDGIKDQFTSGLKLHQEQRDRVIEKIAAYSDAFTKEELGLKTMDELNKLGKLVPAIRDYSGLGGGGVQANTNKIAPMLPYGVETTEKKEG